MPSRQYAICRKRPRQNYVPKKGKLYRDSVQRAIYYYREGSLIYVEEYVKIF